jgi:hypothetical protein
MVAPFLRRKDHMSVERRGSARNSARPSPSTRIHYAGCTRTTLDRCPFEGVLDGRGEAVRVSALVAGPSDVEKSSPLRVATHSAHSGVERTRAITRRIANRRWTGLIQISRTSRRIASAFSFLAQTQLYANWHAAPQRNATLKKAGVTTISLALSLGLGSRVRAREREKLWSTPWRE